MKLINEATNPLTFRKFFIYLTILLLFFVFLFSTLIYFRGWEARRTTGSPFEEGQILIDALGLYLLDKGLYPPELSNLVPEYLEEIPSPNWGPNEWGYGSKHKDNPPLDEFVIRVILGKNNYPRRWYISSTENGIKRADWRYASGRF